jgi:hypothetical protein
VQGKIKATKWISQRDHEEDCGLHIAYDAMMARHGLHICAVPHLVSLILIIWYNNTCSDPYLKVVLSDPVFKDKTKCIIICIPGSSSIHIVTLLVNNQQHYHEKRIKRL